MIENFLKEYAKLIVEYPDKIHIQRVDLDENFVELIIFADKDATSYRVTVKALE